MESDKVNEANVVDRAKHMLDQWLATQMVHNSVNAPIIHVGRAKRLKPQQMIFKCNVDASFFKEDNKVGIGMCIPRLYINFCFG